MKLQKQCIFQRSCPVTWGKGGIASRFPLTYHSVKQTSLFRCNVSRVVHIIMRKITWLIEMQVSKAWLPCFHVHPFTLLHIIFIASLFLSSGFQFFPIILTLILTISSTWVLVLNSPTWIKATTLLCIWNYWTTNPCGVFLQRYKVSNCNKTSFPYPKLIRKLKGVPSTILLIRTWKIWIYTPYINRKKYPGDKPLPRSQRP